MTDRELAKAVHDLQEIARVHAKMEKDWIDAQIFAMELEFYGEGGKDGGEELHAGDS